MDFEVWCVEFIEVLKFNLYLCVKYLFNILFILVSKVCLLIGFEGGLLVEEIDMICCYQFEEILLGLCVLCIEMVVFMVIVVL